MKPKQERVVPSFPPEIIEAIDRGRQVTGETRAAFVRRHFLQAFHGEIMRLVNEEVDAVREARQ